jgi:hypothetical protein
VVGRVAGYQGYQGAGWDWPGSGHGSRPRNFGVPLGGLDFLPFQGTSLKMVGGSDVGDSDRARIEGDFSSWLWLHSRHSRRRPRAAGVEGVRPRPRHSAAPMEAQPRFQASYGNNDGYGTFCGVPSFRSDEE